MTTLSIRNSFAGANGIAESTNVKLTDGMVDTLGRPIVAPKARACSFEVAEGTSRYGVGGVSWRLRWCLNKFRSLLGASDRPSMVQPRIRDDVAIHSQKTSQH